MKHYIITYQNVSICTSMSNAKRKGKFLMRNKVKSIKVMTYSHQFSQSSNKHLTEVHSTQMSL